MGMPSPFEVSRHIGNNLNRSFKSVRERNALEDILSQANHNPEMLQQSIGKILSQVSPERQGPAIQYLQNAYQNMQTRQDKQNRINALNQQGINPYLPEPLQTEIFKQNAKNKRIDDILGGYGINAQQNGGNTQQNNPNTQQNGYGLPEFTTKQGNVKPPSQRRSLEDLSDDQLIRLTGSPDKEISEPAKAVSQSRSCNCSFLPILSSSFLMFSHFTLNALYLFRSLFRLLTTCFPVTIGR